ncbi:FAD-dependent oxidoreductase [Jeongeupia naejangsanensis]|uniref:FAD-dependent oxidoreductase n=1 Tax=Jeongeupia naejangsanensis TaxID=613195 RepID=A0ABS2BGP4_9NEIS|nr:FAD-dependent oxidoreductase [Jeongeupia naejangsanensis]MBM3114779.1 FAD-dependent oxidoreductase [Jeongeupia naejangsanensis]
MNRPIVIIGSGHGGYTLARAYRKLNRTRPVVVVTADDGADYPKPQLSHAFGNGASAERLIRQTASEVAAETSIMVLPNTKVQRIDFDKQVVELGNRTLPYGELVLAVGARPFVPPMTGDAAEAVLTLNSLDDYRQFQTRLANANDVLVIGGGLIGTEIAHDIARHKRVTLVDVNARVLSKQAPAVISARLQAALGDVDFRFGNRVTAIDHDGDRLRATLADGDTLVIDAVVCAAGLKPRLDLAQGLDTATGIVVDAELRTSREHVYALGDCAEIEGRVLPYLQPITLSANALAQTLAGTPTAVAFGPMPVAVKTPRYPVQLGGITGGDIDWQVDEDDNGLTARAMRDGRLVGYATGGGHNGFRLLPQLAR